MTQTDIGLKKIAVAVVATIGAATFATAWSLLVYWSESRNLPDAALGRVIEQSNHGHKFYLTVVESRIVSEPVFSGAALLLGFAAFLNQRWGAFKR